MKNLIYKFFAAAFYSVIFVLAANATTITIDELSLWSGGSIGIGSDVTVSGPMASALGINANSNSIMNSIYTQGNVWLGKSATVDGDAIANGFIYTSKHAEITGTKDSFSHFVLPQLETLQQSAIGTTSIYTPSNGIKTLLPGEYSSMSFGNDAKLNLSAGAYSASSFWMGSGGTVNVDTSAGDVILNVMGSFSSGSSVKFITTGSGNFFVNVFNSDAWLDSRSGFTGFLKVFNGGFGTGTSVDITGAVYATKDIYIGNDSDIKYAALTAIPEPASIAMFMFIGFIIWKVRPEGSTNTSVSAWSARITHC